MSMKARRELECDAYGAHVAEKVSGKINVGDVVLKELMRDMARLRIFEAA
ncbi:hypothetical protein [Paraburkholderia guartelaensis]|uniref:Uncharacterized protein n=1 Tax=Paraburkholderia guartelaensis TaxID=2546446 RepID=A0ABU9S4E4_9BURK